MDTTPTTNIRTFVMSVAANIRHAHDTPLAGEYMPDIVAALTWRGTHDFSPEGVRDLACQSNITIEELSSFLNYNWMARHRVQPAAGPRGRMVMDLCFQVLCAEVLLELVRSGDYAYRFDAGLGRLLARAIAS